MKCVIHCFAVNPLSTAYGSDRAIAKCTTHNWDFGETPITAVTQCPLGRIDDKLDEVIAKIAALAPEQDKADGVGGVGCTSTDTADAARYRHLKEHCSYYYHEGHNPPTPREFGIQWEHVDSTPSRPDMDWLIDQEIEAKRLEALEGEADDASPVRPFGTQ